MARVTERGQQRWGLALRKHVCSLLQPEGTAKSERLKTDLHVASKKEKKTQQSPADMRMHLNRGYSPNVLAAV